MLFATSQLRRICEDAFEILIHEYDCRVSLVRWGIVAPRVVLRSRHFSLWIDFDERDLNANVTLAPVVAGLTLFWKRVHVRFIYSLRCPDADRRANDSLDRVRDEAYFVDELRKDDECLRCHAKDILAGNMAGLRQALERQRQFRKDNKIGLLWKRR